MTFQEADKWLKEQGIVGKKVKNQYEVKRSALITYKQKHGYEYVMPKNSVIIEDVVDFD